MRNKRDKSVYVVLIIMGLVSILSLVFSAYVGTLYIKEKEAHEATKAELTSQINALENSMIDDEELAEKLAENETQTTDNLKSWIKAAVTSPEGGPLTMLRELFPEYLIFYDENSYAFVPVTDDLPKHGLDNANFAFSEDGDLEYVENGVVTSHKGIDVSKYQGNIEWDKVAADGVEYAIIRLGFRGYGSGEIVLDDRFDSNMTGASKAGVDTGIYFFTQAITVEEAIEEAEFCIEHLQGYSVTCPVVFDVEMIVGDDGRANNLTMEERTAITVAFCEKIKEAGYTPMVYGNIKCFTKLLDMTQLTEYKKWYAFYDDYVYYPYEIDMWQYTESGTVDGIDGDVDINLTFE